MASFPRGAVYVVAGSMAGLDVSQSIRAVREGTGRATDERSRK
jgi:uncharacterized protein with ACT and thioredoxin-like domain